MARSLYSLNRVYEKRAISPVAKRWRGTAWTSSAAERAPGAWKPPAVYAGSA